MKKLFAVILVATVALCCVFAQGAAEKEAKQWPDGNVNVIVPAAPGGGTDLVARKFAEVANRVTGKNFIVVNQGDGGGAVAYDTVYHDDEDGLNLGLFIPSFFTTYISGQVNENPMTDYKIACYVDRITAHYIVAKSDAPFKTYEEMVDYIKAHPGEVTFGTSIGSRSHYKMVEWAKAAGLEFKWVEAGKTAKAITALLGGHIDVTTFDAANAKSYAESGDVILFCASDEPLERLDFNKDVRTWAQLGYTELRCQDPVLMVCGKNVPDEIVKQINAMMVQVYSDPELIEYMRANGSALKPYGYEESRTLYEACFNVYDEVGADLGVKAAR